jgi:excinuclease ABC subunit C
MKAAAKQQDFELAATLRNRLNNLKELQRRIMFGDKEFLNISKDKALSDLCDLLTLRKLPARIEGYDISHMSGTNVVASMVVFTNGVSDRANYRKFKTRIEHNNDFYNMHETLSRRLSEKNIKDWGRPDLVLIDGGKGQLDAAIKARDERGEGGIPFIGLAKREEQIVIKHSSALALAGPAGKSAPTFPEQARVKVGAAPLAVTRGSASNVTLNKQKLQELEGYTTITEDFTLINLPHSSHIVKLLQRIRDESHRFAVSYHTVLKRQKQTASSLEEIPGIGPATRKKLIRTFGSLRAVQRATSDQLVTVVGAVKAELIRRHLPAK